MAKVAVVTGGGSGIGQAACRKFAAEGYAVAVLDIREDAARQTVALLEALTNAAGALAVRCDLANPRDVEAAIDATVAKFGRIDTIFHSAGLPSRRAAESESVEHFDAVVAVSARGAGKATLSIR